MKKTFKAIVSLLFLGICAFSANAVPAKRGVMAVEQPDGTTLNIKLVGDEHAHQYFTADDYLLAERDGFFYYATVDEAGMPVSSGIRATDRRTAEATAFLAGIDREAAREQLQAGLEARRAAGAGSQRAIAGLFPESRFPAMGHQKSIVILVEYKDVKMTLTDAHDYFNRMLNEYGFSDYGGTGCGKEFFDFNSMGQFVCDFDVYGPVTLSQNRSYYGGNGWGGDDQNPADMVKEACQQLDGEVDFSEYDRDNDGYVDNVFIFYAGRGEASGGPAESVWPHSWTLTSAGIPQSQRTFDGVIVDRYACSNEYESGRPDGVGTFVHEFSHVIGLPDLYATRYTSSFTPGAWSAMDYGPYNNDGCTPPNYSAFERGALGWMEPVRIQGPMNGTLPPIEQNVAAIIYKDSNPDEYFLFENRQQTGWDTYIPGHGMLVWHVQYDSYVWSRNEVNNTPSHQYVDIEEADGTQNDFTRNGDSFPGTTGKTTFGDTGSPNMKLWNGQGFGLPLTEITEAGGLITFKVAGGTEDIAAPVVEMTGDPDRITLTWEPSDYDLIVTLYKNNTEVNDPNTPYAPDGDPIAANVNCGRSGSYVFDNLEPQTAYMISCYFLNGLQSSATGYSSGFTGRPGLDRLTVVSLEPESITENEFTARWELLPEASDYLITVYERIYGAPNVDSWDFTGYDSDHSAPEGWETTALTTYANTAYSGEAIPALRLANGDKVTTPLYAEDLRTFSFWHRGSNATDADRLALYFQTTDGTWALYNEYEITNLKGGQTITVDVPAGNRAARISYKRYGAKGNVALDDVKAEYGLTYGNVLLENYNGVATGNTDSFVVTGLEPERTYCYEVAGTDGTLVSRKSEQKTAQTLPSSGLTDDVAADRLSVTSAGSVITVAGAEAGAVVEVVDLSGRIVAKASASGAGIAVLPVGQPGFYIVRTGRVIVKTGVR